MKTSVHAWLVLAVAVLAGCKAESRPGLGQTATRAWFTEMRPSRSTDVTLLEDGNVETSLTASDLGALELHWDPAARARALAVHAPAAASVELGGNKEATALEPGWNILPLADRSHATTVKLLEGGSVSEIQLWVEGSVAPWMDGDTLLTAGAWDPGTRLVTPVPDHGSLDPGQASCRVFAFQVPINPTGLQRAVVGLDVTHAWGVFSLGRAINNAPMMEPLGTALEADGQRRAVSAELPLQQLQQGNNTLRLCADGWNRHSIQLEHVRVALELARGSVMSPFPKQAARLVVDGKPDTASALPVELDLRESATVGGLEVIHHGAATNLRIMRGEQEVTVVRREDIPHGTALFLDHTQAMLAGPLRLTGDGSVAEVRVLGLPLQRAIGGQPRVDFPLGGQLLGPYAVVTGTLRGSKANGLVTLTGAGMANGSGVLRDGWFAVSALRTTLDNGSYLAELAVTTEQGEEWVIPLEFTADLTRTTGEGGRATSALPVDEERDRFGLVGGPPARGTITAEGGGVVKLGSDVLVRFPKGAVTAPTEVTIQRMSELAVHPLNPGMINVTAPGGALYRFEPSPRQFQEKVTITLPYDPNLVPPNIPSSEIRTYYFDVAEQKYVALETLDVDESQRVVLALTDHFTDMINAVLMQPESPTPQSFNPNAISGLAAADPTTGMTLVAPPEPRSDGSASITYPFQLPKARGRYQPQLALTYNSQGGMGQAGWGWSLTTSSIEVDTRYGAPEYAAPGSGRPGERYVWDGQQMVPTDTTLTCSNGENGRQFRLRREGRFARIVRCGDGPTTYSWEVTEKDGTRFVYGRNGNARLADVRTGASGAVPANIGRWMLEMVVDVDGNRTEYGFMRGQTTGLPVLQYQELASITYTYNGTSLLPSHQVLLNYRWSAQDAADAGAAGADGSAPERSAQDDASIEGALGFAATRQHRLVGLRVECLVCAAERLAAEYTFTYGAASAGSMGRTLLESISSFGAAGAQGGGEVHETRFDYYGATESPYTFGESDGTARTWARAAEDKSPLTAAFSANRQGDASGHAAFGFAFANNLSGPSLGQYGSLSAGETTPLVTMADMNGDGLVDRVLSRASPLRGEVPGAAWLYDKLTQRAAQNGQAEPVVFLNTGTGFVRAPEYEDLPSPGHDFQAGVGLGAQFGVGVDAVSLGGNMGLQQGLQLTTDALMDLNGDGLVDSAGPDPKVQVIGSLGRFDATQEAPGAGCLDARALAGQAAADPAEAPDQPEQDSPIELMRDTVEEGGRRDAVWRWRAPHDGAVHVVIRGNALVECSAAGTPPTLTATAVKGPPTAEATRLPIPGLFGTPPLDGDKPFAPGGVLQRDTVARFMREALVRYQKGGISPSQEPPVTWPPVSMSTTATEQEFDIPDMKRGGEILVRLAPGTSCASDDLEGLVDAADVRIIVKYAECGDAGCITPYSSSLEYDSASDFRQVGAAFPLVIRQKMASARLSGTLWVGAPADLVSVRVRKLTCDLNIMAFRNLARASRATPNVDTVEDFPFNGFNSNTIISEDVLQLGTLDDVRIPREVLLSTPGCAVEDVQFHYQFDNASGDTAELMLDAPMDTISITGTLTGLEPGDLVYVDVKALSPIDPGDVVAGPFRLDFALPEFQHNPLMAGAGQALDDPGSSLFAAVPVAVSARPLEPVDGKYRHLDVREGQTVRVRLAVPPTWALASDKPTLLLQQDGWVHREEVLATGLPGACPAPELVCGLWCVPPGCGNVCQRQECFQAPDLPAPVFDYTFTAASSGPLFISLEPPKNILKHGLRPDPWHLGDVLSFAKAWLDPGSTALALAGWFDWQVMVEGTQRPLLQRVSPATVTVGGVIVEHAINVLEPSGTHGLPLPLPMASLASLLTADGYRGWGYGEYWPDPDEASGEGLEIQVTPDTEASADWAASADGVHNPGARLADLLASPGVAASFAPAKVRDAVQAQAQDIKDRITSLVNPDRSPVAVMKGALGRVKRMAHDTFKLPRVSMMFPSGTGYHGTCHRTRIQASGGQPGRCLPGDVPHLDGLPALLPSSRQVVDGTRRALLCPRAVPRVTANLGLLTSARASVFGLQLSGNINAAVMEYRDVTGDGIPDTVLSGPGGIVVLPAERTAPGVRTRKPLLTPAALPPQATLSFSGGPNFAGSIPAMGIHGTGSNGRGQAGAANVPASVGRESLAFVPSASGSGNLQLDIASHADFNGDGLPDLVRTSRACAGLSVRLNVGGRYQPALCVPADSPTPNGAFLGIGAQVTVNGTVGWAASSQRGNEAGMSQSISASRHNQHVMFLDVNGDGLPDIVGRVLEGWITVNFNLGDHYSDGWSYAVAHTTLPGTLELDGGLSPLPGGTGFNLHPRTLDMRAHTGGLYRFLAPGFEAYSGLLPDTLAFTTSVTYSAQEGVGFGTPTFPAGASFHVSVGGTNTASWGNVGFMDMDGDGLPEPVSAPVGSDAFHVRVNQLGKVNRLRRVVNPLGGTITVDYQRAGNTFDMPQNRWVMSSVSVDHNVRSMVNGVNDDLPVNRVHARAFKYENGKWDRYNRDFYGFARVVTEDEPLTSGAQDSRRRCVDYAVDSFARAGKVTRERLTTGDCDDPEFLEETATVYFPAVRVSVVNDPLLCPVPQPMPADACASTVVHPALVARTSKENGQVASLKAELFGDYDPVGNPLLVVDADDVADPSDDVTMRVIYQAPGEKYVASLPLHFEAYVGGNLVRARDGEFDANGHLTLHRAWFEGGSLETRYTWDDVGNPTQVKQPTGYTVDITYEPTRTFPETVTDNLGVVTKYSDFEYRWGQPRTQEDANAGVLARTLDDRGRVLTVASPLTRAVVLTNTYSCIVPGTFDCARTTHVVESNGAELVTLTAVDGMGEKRYVAKEEEFPGSPAPAVFLGAHHVDRWGRKVLTSKPLAGSLTFFAATHMPGLQHPTQLQFDARDRVVLATEPPERTTHTSYSAVVAAGVPRLLVSTLDPLSMRTDQVMDGKQVLEVHEYNGADSSLTHYRYDPLDQLVGVVQGGYAFATLTYDALGRVKTETTMDTGTRTPTYDPTTGLLTQEVNGAGQVTRYGYDANSSRLTFVDRGGGYGVYLRYGVPGDVGNTVGRLKDALFDAPVDPLLSWDARRELCLDSALCSAENYAYDTLGQQTRHERTYRQNGSIGTLRVTQSYDSFGRVLETLTDAGTRSNGVRYTYNGVGRPIRVDGYVQQVGPARARTWVESVVYDHQGRTVAMELGNNVRREYTYSPETDWLERLVTCSGGGTCLTSTNVQQNMVLTYDKAGNITHSAASATDPAVPELRDWSYTYDGRHRLATADLVLSHAGASRTWNENWAYDGLHRMTSHLMRTVADSGPVKSVDEAFTFTGLHQPHCMPGYTCQEERATYDGAGRVEWLTNLGTPRVLSWTADGMLRKVEVPGSPSQELVRNGYAMAGERTTRVDDSGVARFLGPVLARTGAGANTHVFVNGQRVATEYGGGTAYYVTDRIGSTSMVLGSDGALASHVVLSPYGEEVVTSTGTVWSETGQRFLVTGKERDEATGYDAYGWRFYSSKGMTWLSPEPMFVDAFKQGPFGTNLYGFVRGRPTVQMDPDGRGASWTTDAQDPEAGAYVLMPVVQKTYSSADAAAYAGLTEARQRWSSDQDWEWGIGVDKEDSNDVYVHGEPYTSRLPTYLDHGGRNFSMPRAGWNKIGFGHDHGGYRPWAPDDERANPKDKAIARETPVFIGGLTGRTPSETSNWLATPRGGFIAYGPEDPMGRMFEFGFAPRPGAPQAVHDITGKPVGLTPPASFSAIGQLRTLQILRLR